MRLLDRNWGDRISQPGYVGRLYAAGGLAFVSMNPGGGPNEGLGAHDLAQYELLQKLRDSSEADAPTIFLELTETLERLMPSWKIVRNFVSPVLESANVDFSRVAYLNLLKWRTKSSSGLSRLYDLSWNDHAQEQFALLRPGMVVAIGADAGKAFRRHDVQNVHIDSIPRVIGNNIGSAGHAALRRIKEWLEHRRQDGG